MHDDPSRRDPEPCGFWRSRYAVGLLAMGGVAAFFLWREHRAHLLGALPLLLLLACPLMHVFMHRGHGGHGGGHARHTRSPGPQAAPPRADPTGDPP